MLGMGDIARIQATLALGPEEGGRVAGESAHRCDPFYRAWLRTVRRELTHSALEGGGARVDLEAARVWVTSGEWGDTASADLEMLAFDHGLLETLAREAAAALSDGRSWAEAQAALRLHDQCARVHEAFEEVLMDLRGDPDRDAHVECHHSLRAQREQVLACHARGDLASARSLLAAFRGWADEHARGPDLGLERYLRAAGGAR